MSTEIRAGCLVANAPSQTLSKQPTVCVKPAAVWPLSVKQGPTRWASSSSTLRCFLTAWLDGLASVLRFTDLTSSSVSPKRPKNTLFAPIRHVFPSLVSLWWEKPPLLFPVLTAQSAEANLWQEHTSPNRWMSRQFEAVCHEEVISTVLDS